MENKELPSNGNLKAVMGRWNISVTKISQWINKSVVATSKKIEYQTFTQLEMKMILQRLQEYENIDMNIFL